MRRQRVRGREGGGEGDEARGPGETWGGLGRPGEAWLGRGRRRWGA